MKTSPYYPQSNGKLERFHKTLKSEYIRPGTPLSLADARRIVARYVEHYHRERNHQGLDNRLIDPSDVAGEGQGRIHCRERLGGMLKYYYRKAA